MIQINLLPEMLPNHSLHPGSHAGGKCLGLWFFPAQDFHCLCAETSISFHNRFHVFERSDILWYVKGVHSLFGDDTLLKKQKCQGQNGHRLKITRQIASLESTCAHKLEVFFS